MTRIQYIEASPCEADSHSSEIARARIGALRQRKPGAVVDELNLWRESLPAFDGNSAAAKVSFFGIGTLDGARKTAWDRIVEVIERFETAEHYVISTPMSNAGIPYRLKLYIDILTQPGLLSGFDPKAGYFDLLKGKSATFVCTSGVYAPGVRESFGVDFHSNYLDWWFRCNGVEKVRTIRFLPTMVTTDPAKVFADAMRQARAVA